MKMSLEEYKDRVRSQRLLEHITRKSQEIRSLTTKDLILTHVLSYLKMELSTKLYHTIYAWQLLRLARMAGHDYPEFKIIEKYTKCNEYEISNEQLLCGLEYLLSWYDARLVGTMHDMKEEDNA